MKQRSLALALTIALFAGAAYALGWSTLFTVSSVEIKGTKAVMASTIKIGQKLARVEPRAVAAEFEKFDWIERADLSRNWVSGKVTIFLTERIPIAMYNDRAIDSDGVDFAVTTQEVKGLPRIQGISIESAVAASAFFMGLPPEIADSVSLIKIRGAQSYLLEIVTGRQSIEVLWGQDEENALKTKVYKALIAQPENKTIRRIDLSAPHAPIVK